MNITIPNTSYTKAILVSATLKGIIVVFMWDIKKATKGDICHFWNKNGYSKHELQNNY